MYKRISIYWIPFVENLPIANGRNAYWNQKKSVIMIKGDDVGKIGEWIVMHETVIQ